MRCSRIKEYDNMVIVEKERTRKYFVSSGDLLNDDVVGLASLRHWPLCWPRC
jgi:hypothetical protein